MPLVSKLFRAYGLYNNLRMKSYYILGNVSKLFRAYGLYNFRGIYAILIILLVSKLFRAYGLYNPVVEMSYGAPIGLFQSSFELTGYITLKLEVILLKCQKVSKLFRAYGLYNLCSLEGA